MEIFIYQNTEFQLNNEAVISVDVTYTYSNYEEAVLDGFGACPAVDSAVELDSIIQITGEGSQLLELDDYFLNSNTLYSLMTEMEGFKNKHKHYLDIKQAYENSRHHVSDFERLADLVLQSHESNLAEGGC